MLDLIRERLAEEASAEGIVQEKLTFLKRNGGDFSAKGKLLFEVLGPGGGDPLWIVKAARSSDGNKTLGEENNRLVELREILPEHLLPTIPKPVFYEERPTGSLSGESFLRGEKLSRLLRTIPHDQIWEDWKRYAEVAIGWLTDYSRVCERRSITIDSNWWEQEIFAPLERHNDILRDCSPLWNEVFARVKNRISQFEPRQYEIIPQHGDFTPVNIVFSGSDIGVYDWSPVSHDSPPLLDLFHFLMGSSLRIAMNLDGADRVSDIRTPVVSDPRFLEPLGLLVSQYCEENRIPPEGLEPLSYAALLFKILGYADQEEPVVNSLRAWIFGLDHWEKSEVGASLVHG